jgi:glycosyltransferase involved in cell wall biosynthesis
LKLCIVTSSYPAAPDDVAAPFAPPLVEQLRELGDEVSVLALDRGRSGAGSAAGVHWFGRGWARGATEARLLSPRGAIGVPSLLVQGERALGALIAEDRPDLCLALWAIPAGYWAWRIKARFGIPYAVWALGSDINAYADRVLVGRLLRRILRGARHRFADGVALAARVEAISGLDCLFLPTTRRLPAPSEVDLPGASPRFLFVGRLEPVKGVDILLDAWRIAVGRGCEGHLSIVGSGSLAESMRRSIADPALAGRTTLLPPADAGEVAGYMAAADCLVVPSRSESIPLVFSEALQTGLPLLVSEAGDMGRLAREHGLLAPVPIGDPEALADAMLSVAADPAGTRRRFGEAAARLRPQFDLKASAARLQAVLESG